MSDRRDPAFQSNELLIRQLEDAGWTLYYSPRLGDRVVAGHKLSDVAKRALEPPKAKR
jgi:hypothetical protein